MDELAEKASSFYADVFTLEWKKMVLPVIMVLALSVSAYSTLDLRNSPQSEDRMDLSAEAMTNISVISLKTEYFNESTNKSGKELSQEISREAQREEKQIISSKLITKAQIGHIQKLGLFPFTPKLYTPIPASREDAITTLAVINYRQDQFEELDRKLNSSENMTLEEFNSEVETIRDSNWKDEKVQTYLENYTFDENTGTAGLTTSEDIREQIRTGKIQELSFTSYLPAILATFLLYYVVNALAVETGRKAYTQVKEHEKQQEDEKTGEKDSGEEEKAGDETDGENRE